MVLRAWHLRGVSVSGHLQLAAAYQIVLEVCLPIAYETAWETFLPAAYETVLERCRSSGTEAAVIDLCSWRRYGGDSTRGGR